MIPKIEKASLNKIKALQEQKLLETLEYVNAHSPYYQRLFKKENINISDIKTIKDLRLLPVTTKEDLQKYNDDFLCVPANKIIDFATTSGTLGEPVTFGLTDADLERLAYNEAISFDCAGIKEGDIVQLMTTIDRRFMAGLAYFLGLAKNESRCYSRWCRNSGIAMGFDFKIQTNVPDYRSFFPFETHRICRNTSH